MSKTFDDLMKRVNGKKNRRRSSDKAVARAVGKRVYDLDANTIATEQSDDSRKDS